MSSRLWRFSLLICCLGVSDAAAERTWQTGIWRDIQHFTTNGTTITEPVGPPGKPYWYSSTTRVHATECVTIDGSDGIRYVGCWGRIFDDVIINDPIDFTVEKQNLFVRGLKPGKDNKLKLVSRTRLVTQ